MLQDISKDGSKAAFGSEGAELSIWDIATQQRSYIAKGSKPNRIGLVDHPQQYSCSIHSWHRRNKGTFDGALRISLIPVQFSQSRLATC